MSSRWLSSDSHNSRKLARTEQRYKYLKTLPGSILDSRTNNETLNTTKTREQHQICARKSNVFLWAFSLLSFPCYEDISENET